MLGLVVALCYAQTVYHQFVWDTVHIFQNEQVRNFSWNNTVWIFTHPILANWIPFSWLSHTLDFVLFGWSTGGHHVTNVLIHFLNGCVLYFLVKQLAGWKRRIDGNLLVTVAALSALLFVLHPLRVESVAWVAARKDLLYSFFFMLSIMAYVNYVAAGEEHDRRKYYLTSLLLFVFSLLSKSMAVTLPAVLLVLDCYPLNRAGISSGKLSAIAKSILPDKIPYFVLSIVISMVTLLTQSDAMPDSTFSSLQQILNAMHNAVFHIGKFLVPLSLSPFYPFPSLEEVNSVGYWLPALLALVLIFAISILWAVKGNPLALICWILYLTTLSPASGVIHVGSAASADRYTYLTLLPVTVLLSVGIVRAYVELPRFRSLTVSLTLFVLLSLGALTHAQVSWWQTPISLWSRVLHIYPDAALARRNISASYNFIGDHESALIHLQHISAQGWDVDTELARTLALTGRKAEAIALYKGMLLSDKYSGEEKEAFENEIIRHEEQPGPPLD